ncbi:hypothetical protein [Streptosporangium sandarakinum]|uniref:hypothetical protein n=1 Tax=Streptosporangium sandarakinum TaxID=1260955 RepID=UPI00378C7710
MKGYPYEVRARWDSRARTSDDDAVVTTASPDDFLAAGTGRALLARADLIDAGVRVVVDSGGRLAAGSAALDALLWHVNAHLAAT